MNLILLSGGSGQRLWPLSNNIRSKQFVPLLKNAAGEHESMVQRVYRQIMAADPGANIVVATGKRQVSTIRNQLGGKVSVCVEPCRRDTFPAIVLACPTWPTSRACAPTNRSSSARWTRMWTIAISALCAAWPNWPDRTTPTPPT